MVDGKRSRVEAPDGAVPGAIPEIAACASGPGTIVFIEADNTDGWIATDRTVDLRR